MHREYDHRPPLFLREVNAEGTDYVPPQNDPHFIEALHKDCHLKRTVGRVVGAEKTVTTKGSDSWLRKKFNRLAREMNEHLFGDKPKHKRKIPSRPFPKRRKNNDKA